MLKERQKKMKVGASQRKVGDESAVKITIATVPPSEWREREGREREVKERRKVGWRWKEGQGPRVTGGQPRSCVLCGWAAMRWAGWPSVVSCLLALLFSLGGAALDKNQISATNGGTASLEILLLRGRGSSSNRSRSSSALRYLNQPPITTMIPLAPGSLV